MYSDNSTLPIPVSKVISSGTVPMYTYILVALCQCMLLYHSGTAPIPASISQWHCAKVYLYTLVALCQCIRLFSSGTMPMYTYTSIFLWNSVNACLYEYFLVVLYQCMLYMYAS